MRPTTLLQRLLGLIWTPFFWTQCKAELPFDSEEWHGCSYCMRRKWHGGPHVTNDGQQFYTPPNYGY